MIYKNEKQIELNFGYGDILITPLYWDDDGTGGVGFRQADHCYEIGENLGVPDDFDVSECDVVMTFEVPESIDVLINKLQDVKKAMLQ